VRSQVAVAAACDTFRMRGKMWTDGKEDGKDEDEDEDEDDDDDDDDG
jgi:hypothetical protein